MGSSTYYVSQADSFKEHTQPYFTMTPVNVKRCGQQLFLLSFPHRETAEEHVMHGVFASLKSCGIIGAQSYLDVIRIAPIPLYNTSTDVWNTYQRIQGVFSTFS